MISRHKPFAHESSRFVPRIHDRIAGSAKRVVFAWQAVVRTWVGECSALLGRTEWCPSADPGYGARDSCRSVQNSGSLICRFLRWCVPSSPWSIRARSAALGRVACANAPATRAVAGWPRVEPMRTEDDHQRRGLARHVLTAGVALLASAGAQRIKIVYDPDNPASGHLYRSVGFEPHRYTDVLAGPTTS